MDSLTGLRVFCTVAELEGFTAAARRLGLSPAMTSKRVMHLEDRLGIRLLNRTSRLRPIVQRCHGLVRRGPDAPPSSAEFLRAGFRCGCDRSNPKSKEPPRRAAHLIVYFR